MKKPRFSKRFRHACLIVAEQCHGAKGTWAYEAFEYINKSFFSERLPWPHIMWGLTAHGGCLAWSCTDLAKSRPPIVMLHPALLGGGESDNPWGIPRAILGPSYVFDVLLHECIHIHVEYNLGGQDGATSHNCKRWVRQVNRLAPLLGFENIRAGGAKTTRIPDPTLPRTVRGKMRTRVVRATTGNIPFSAVAHFPSSIRIHQGTAFEHYSVQRLPKGVSPLDDLR